jgi:hypothetical protein
MSGSAKAASLRNLIMARVLRAGGKERKAILW